MLKYFSLQAFISDDKNHLQDAILFHILKYCHLDLQLVIELEQCSLQSNE